VNLATLVDNWPTATTEAGLHNRKGASATSGDGLSTAAKNWGTPTANEYSQDPQRHARKSAELEAKGSRPLGVQLASQAKNWTTPQAHDVKQRGSGQKPTAAAGNACLARDAVNFPSPASRDYRTPNKRDYQERSGSTKGEQLQNFVAHQFILQGPAIETLGPPSSEWRPISRRLFRSAMSNVPPITQRRWLRRDSWRNARLCPPFVEWLMGWPPGHALCGCSATEFAHWSQHMRSCLSALPTASAAWIWEPAETLVVPEQLELI